MGTNTLKSNNIQFPIYNEDGTPFEGLVLRKAAYDSVVMSLGDKITGEVVYKDNTLAVTMHEYIEFKNDPDDENEDPVRFSIVNPPTIIREGLVKDNSDLKGMTKYSFEFYHPMYQLSNMPFSDVAVSSDESKYLSENKTFSWIGKPQDYINKLNKNLQDTEWVVVMSSRFPQDKADTLSEVLAFDNKTIADALKTAYDTWEVPYIVDSVRPNEYSYIDEHNVQRDYYDDGKRFVVVFGLPSNKIYASEADRQTDNPFVFKMGQGVGLKNNSRNPRNNKIITRIAGRGSENNIPYGYPQIIWYGNQNWDYTINNDPLDPHSYPIYKGIVGGQYVKLIKHPFTRKNLMPSVYSRSVFNKVSPYNPWSGNVPSYNQTLWQLKQRIQSQYSQESTAVEIEAYETLLEKLDEAAAKSSGSVDFSGTQFEGSIYNNGQGLLNGYLQINEEPIIEFEFESVLIESKFETNNPSYNPDTTLIDYYDAVASEEYPYLNEINPLAPSYEFHEFEDIRPEMDDGQSNVKILGTTPLNKDLTPADSWDDTMDDDGNYVQSYFSVDLPVLSFDIYACAAITQEMQINMRSGACLGCTFTIQVDWDDYKKNFYDANGNFDPNIGEGHPRDAEKYPDSSVEEITVICQKETQTFGTLMPNRYQSPQANDEFVVLGISLPIEYIENAETRLDGEMKSYMLENNVYYYDYPLKFDEYFLVNHKNILRQLKPNAIVRFEFAGEELQLFVKQLSIKYGESPLPQYNITLTDNIEVVLNQIGQVAEDVERLGSLISIMRQSYGNNVYAQIASKLSKRDDDTASGLITFLKGVLFGNSGLWGIDGNGDGVLRNLNVEKLEAKVAHFFELIIDKIRSVGGRIVVTAANAEITRVVEVYNSDDEPKLIGWKCYWPNTDGDKTIRNEFVAGDQVMCASFNEVQTGESQNVVNKYYWRLCKASGVENGENFVFLSDVDGEKATIIQGIPEVGDNLVLMGYNDAWRESHPEESASDFAERQAAIVLSAYNNAWLKPSDVQREIKAPCYVQYEGINSFDIVASNIVTVISSSGNEFRGTFRVVSGADIEKVGRIVYKSSPIRPETPTGTTIPPVGWGTEPKDEYGSIPFVLSYSGDWTNIGGYEWKSSQISDEQVTRERVTFQTTGNAVIHVRLTSDSEGEPEADEWYDIIGVGNVDVDLSWAGYDDLGDGNNPDYFAGRCAGQGKTVVVQLKVTGAGQHFFDVLYWKDTSTSIGGDYGTFKVLGGEILPIWASVFDGIETWSVPVRWSGADGSDGKSGKDGTSPVVVDLSNEMDAVACNAGGEVAVEQSVTTTVRPYKGTAALSIDNIAVKIGNETIGTAYGSDDTKDSYYVKATTNTTTGAVTVYFRQGYTMSAPKEVSIVVTCDGKYYTLTFTVTGMRPGADGTPATIYNLKPNPTAIKTAQVSGGYNPSKATLTCGYTKNVGGSVETVMDVTGRIDDKYNVYFRLRKRADGSYTNYYLYYNTTNKTVLANLELTTYDAVEFILCTDTATTVQSPTGVIDRETVPVVADGLQGSEGKDAVVYKLTPIVEQALVSRDKELTVNLQYKLLRYEGDTSTDYGFSGFFIECTVGSTPTGIGKSFVISDKTASLDKSITDSYSGSPLFYTVSLYYGNDRRGVLVDRRTVPVTMAANVVFEVGEDAVTSAVTQVSNIKNYFGFNRGILNYPVSNSEVCQLYPYGYGMACWGSLNRVYNLGLGTEDNNSTWTLYFEARTLSSSTLNVNVNFCDTNPNTINGVTTQDGQITLSTSWQVFRCVWSSTVNNITNEGLNGYIDFEQSGTAQFYIRKICLVKGVKPMLEFVKADEDLTYSGGLQNFQWNIGATLDTEKFMGMNVYKNPSTLNNSTVSFFDFFLKTIDIKNKTPYTLSFWAKASVDNVVIVSHLYESSWNLWRAFSTLENMTSTDGACYTTLSKEWKHYTVHWFPNVEAVTGTDASKKLVKNIIGCRLQKMDSPYGNNNALIYLAGVTYQEGWVEDGQSTIAFQTSEIKQTAEGITATVQNLQTTVEGHTDDITRVEQKADGVKSTVDSMKIGGRNLILNGAFNYDNKYWSDWGSPTTREIVTQNKTKWMHIVTSSGQYEGYSQNHFSDYGITIKGGTTYTVSFRAYATANIRISVGCHWFLADGTRPSPNQNWLDFDLTTSAKKYSAQFNVPADTLYFNFMIGNRYATTAGLNFYITDIQLEEGTMATDWRESIEENHSLIEQTADNIRLEVESCGINISEKQITLDGNTQVNGNLNLNSSDQGFTIAGNEGSTQISPQSVGKVATATNTYATTVSDSVVSQLVQRSSDQYDGTFIMSQTFGKINSGAEISGYSSSSWLTFMKPNSGSVVSAISYSITYGIYINNVLRYPIEITSSTISNTWTQRVDYTGELKIMVTITARFNASAVETSTTISAVPSLRCNHIYKLTLPTSVVRTLIGYDGMRMSFGNNNSVFFGSDGALIKYGDYGLKVTSDGLQRWNGSTWVGFNVKETATIAAAASSTAFSSLKPIGDSVEVAMVTSGGDQYKIRLPNNPHNGQILRVYNISSNAITIWANKTIRWNETTYSAGSAGMSLDNYRGCEIIYNNNVWHAHKFTE